MLTDSIWTPLQPWEMLYHRPEGSSIPEKTVLPWRQVNVLAIFLDKTMNTHFLSPLQWHTVPTGSNQIPVHPWNMLYHGPQGSSTPRKPVLPCTSINILAISSGSYHDWLHIFWVHCSGTESWLTPSGFWTPVHPWNMLYYNQKDPQHLKNGFAIKAIQCSGYLYWIKPWKEANRLSPYVLPVKA